MIDAAFAIAAFVLILLALDVFAARVGADSRDGQPWRIVD